jgi:hypothetical protein
MSPARFRCAMPLLRLEAVILGLFDAGLCGIWVYIRKVDRGKVNGK